VAVNGNRWRILYDAAIFLGVVSLAFYAGQLTERVRNIEVAVVTPGRVMISIEARERITKLEGAADDLKRRVENLERK
jgi:hypothetical protein